MQILCDYYNLHLESGTRENVPYHKLKSEQKSQDLQAALKKGRAQFTKDGVIIHRGEVWPDYNERSRIVAFFEKYCPEVLSPRDAKSVKLEPIELEEGYRSEGLVDSKGSLGVFEWLNGHQWFQSKSYIHFADDWWRLKRLLDNIIAGEIELVVLDHFCQFSLHWFTPQPNGSAEYEGYSLSINLIRPDGKEISPFGQRYRYGTQTVRLGEWKFKATYRATLERFNLNIGPMLDRVHRCVIGVLENPTVLGRCQAGKTPKREYCQNVFIHKKRRGPRKKYCSGTCRRRDYEATKNNKRKSNEISPK